MSSSNHKRVSELFLAASRLPKDDRKKFLNQECAGDSEIRAAVESLLVHHEHPVHSLSKPLVDQSTVAMTSNRIVGQNIGSYRITRLIATGGMGSVYEAVQEKPRRSVALKVMRHGIASRSALRRFEFESQLLARLRHPGIAQVFEAGTHDEGTGGVPYFAMEYIPNAMSITESSRAKHLSMRERLELFMKVCEAVHHGHQKGIIHRDLKPSNILVDSSGQPKVIDFGVARSTDSDMAVTTMQTSVGELIGTLQYMSPEQCAADPHDLDTRSDVYSLGVVLYELLCEQMPYDISRVQMYEATRVIREQAPGKPSTINRKLKGDVETIVLKALEKERERRYQSAAELAQEIQRYLSDQPILARPPSMMYQWRTFARRNRALVSGVVAVFVVLVLGVIGTSIGMVKAINAESRAEREAEIAKAVNEFLNEDLLAVVSPEELGKDVLMREVLDAASDRIKEASAPGGRFADKPLIEAAVRSTLGETYFQLGESSSAEEHLNRAIHLRNREQEPHREETIHDINRLAGVYYLMNRFDECERLAVENLTTARDVLGEEHEETLQAMYVLSSLYQRLHRYEEAESLSTELFDTAMRTLGEKHKKTASVMLRLGSLYVSQQRFDEAEPLLTKVLELRTNLLGEDHPRTLDSARNLAGLYRLQNRSEEAEELYRNGIESQSRVLGADHIYTLSSKNALAYLLLSQGRYEESESLYLEIIESVRRSPSGNLQMSIEAMSMLAHVYQLQGHSEKAGALTREAMELARTELSDQHPSTARLKNNVAYMLLSQDSVEQHELEQALVLALEANTVMKFNSSPFLNTLALAYYRTGDYQKAVETISKAIDLLPEDSTEREEFNERLAEYEAALRGVNAE